MDDRPVDDCAPPDAAAFQKRDEAGPPGDLGPVVPEEGGEGPVEILPEVLPAPPGTFLEYHDLAAHLRKHHLRRRPD
jgi:hypothetical protein